MVASQEAREKNRDEIVLHYYNEFVKSLKEIGFMTKPPGVLDLNVELMKNGFLEVVITVCFLPFFYMDTHTQDPEIAFETGIEGLNLRKNLYQEPRYKQMVTKVMSDYLYKGLLN
jgi:hypothetical protein